MLAAYQTFSNKGAQFRMSIKLINELISHFRWQPEIRTKALEIIRDVPERDVVGIVEKLFEFVRDRITFRDDPRDVETITTPLMTLDNRAGDCDDKAVLLGALLESVGVRTRTRTISQSPNGNYTHIVLQAWLPVEDERGLVLWEWVSLDPARQENKIGYEPTDMVTRTRNHSIPKAASSLFNILSAPGGVAASPGNHSLVVHGRGDGNLSGYDWGDFTDDVQEFVKDPVGVTGAFLDDTLDAVGNFVGDAGPYLAVLGMLAGLPIPGDIGAFIGTLASSQPVQALAAAGKVDKLAEVVKGTLKQTGVTPTEAEIQAAVQAIQMQLYGTATGTGVSSTAQQEQMVYVGNTSFPQRYLYYGAAFGGLAFLIMYMGSK